MRRRCFHFILTESLTFVLLIINSFLLFPVEYFTHVMIFLKRWAKHPHWSATCCQNLLLPVHDLQEDTGNLISNGDLKDKDQVESGQVEMVPIHAGEKDNEGFEAICGENEIDEVDCQSLIKRADTIYRDPGPDDQPKEGEEIATGIHEIDLGVGTGLNKTRVKRNQPQVHEVIVDVHDVDIGVNRAGGKGKQVSNVGCSGADVGVNDFDAGDKENTEKGLGVEMCDQESQTDLSLLDEMDEEAIVQMGFAHDESL